MTTMNITRRGFLKTAGAGAAVLVLGVRPNGAVAAGESASLNPFVKIGADGRVTAIVKHFEMGQGPTTGLSTLIAEEMGVGMEQIDMEFAPSNPQVYNNLLFGPFQGTGGSTAIANSWEQYRKAGAAAREMLIGAAAKEWGLDAASLSLKGGVISGGGKSAPLGDFVAAAMAMEPPAEPALKAPSEWVLIGNPEVLRIDNSGKVDGTAQFAMDVMLPGQMVVTMIRPPRMGAVVKGFDASSAEGISGFIRAAALPANEKVAIFAENTWAAFQARDAVSVEWDFTNAESRSSEEVKAGLMEALEGDAAYQVGGELAPARKAIESAAQVLEETFYFPLLAHAPMEPLTCTIEQDSDGVVTLHDGCQMPTLPHSGINQILGTPMEKIRVNTLYAGGSFGRRANPTMDYQAECIFAFAITDKTRPVKLVWSREDDITGGYYRPAFAHKVRMGLDSDGNIVGWDHRIAGQSIMKGTPFEAFSVVDGVDGSSVEGVSDTHYAIPGFSARLTDTPKATSVLWWRSVGHSHTAYAMETMIDVAAEAAGVDPVEYRLRYLPGDDKDQMRLATVLKLAAQKAGWGSPVAGRTQGIAVHKSFGSYVAEVVEISNDNGIRIEKVTCAVDCGVAVNPSTIRAQMEGGIGYGIGHAILDEVTLKNGEIQQSNFPDYEPMKIGMIHDIDVHIVASTEAPTGVGEPGVPPSAVALANAIAKATGTRISEHPMNKSMDFA